MRRTQLLRKELVPNKGDRAQLLVFSDVHIGAKECQEDFARERLAHCLKQRIYVMGLGDLIENAIVGGKSDVYEQKLTPEVQIETAVEWLMPLAKAGLLLGLHEGN